MEREGANSHEILLGPFFSLPQFFVKLEATFFIHYLIIWIIKIDFFIYLNSREKELDQPETRNIPLVQKWTIQHQKKLIYF